MALTKVTKSGVASLPDDIVSEEHIDVTSITGFNELAEQANDNDFLLIFDASASTLKKVKKSNITLGVPTVTAVSPTAVVSGDGTGNHTFVITGTNLTGGGAKLINNGGSNISFDSVTVNSDTQITGVIAKSSLPGSGEPYDVSVNSAEGLTAVLENQINIDQSPTFNTSAGSIASLFNGGRTVSGDTISVSAFDPESAGNVTFELQSGSLPAGLSTSTVHENGVSKFRLTGTATAQSSNTTSNFVLRAVDAASNTSSRAFSVTVNAPQATSFTTSGTFSVPTGLTTVDVLVVAGGGHGGYQHAGGGGAGGLIYRPGFTVTPGGTVTVTVGAGGSSPGGNSALFPQMTGQDSVFGTLTAKGGGHGASGGSATPTNDGPGTASAGGSGGGAGYNPSPNCGGAATQPTQSGDSGAYGFGNAGGNSTGSGSCRAGGGGGGAGAAGQPSSNKNGGDGGVGKAYTIADGTTSVYYAGGGGGSQHAQPSGLEGQGGQGGGGNGGGAPGPAQGTDAQDGQANKGGGGGGAHYASNQQSFGGAPAGYLQGAGGKGIVIVSF